MFAKLFQRISPLKLLLFGYGSYVCIGWLLLSIPFCWNQEHVGALDNLFTATSAVSTTGLATVGTPDGYSFWGQLVILVLIQIGAIGYMTLGSFILLAKRPHLPAGRTQMAKLVFSLPEGFHIRGFLRNVVIFSLTIESLGALGLYFAFRADGVENPVWQAIFHSVSSFCTAGFSLFPNSLENFADNFWVNAIVSALSLSGAIGFLVLSDFSWSLFGDNKRKTLTTRIILWATFVTLFIGWAILFLIDPNYREMPNESRFMASGFQAMSALTTVGFNTTPISGFANGSCFLIIILMILGASPSGTGGGLKSTTVSAAFATVMGTLKGKKKITFWGCEVPQHRLMTAFAAIVFYIAIFSVGGLCMLLTEQHSIEDTLFETASALGTVGLSRGITSELSPLGKICIVALMFVGRIGPITFGLALFSGEDETQEIEDIAV